MGVKIEADAGNCTIHFEDELTIYNVAECRKQILESCTLQEDVEADLSSIKEIDTGGLQLLAALNKQLVDGGYRLNCSEPGETVLEAFELSRFSDVLNNQNTGLTS